MLNRSRWTGRLIFSCIWLLVVVNCAAAPTSQQTFLTPYIRNFSKQNYQAYNQNWAISQDTSTGFVYVANSKGLLEFDGSRWQTYRLPKRQIVRAVAVDQKGLIFTGGLGEFGYWQANPTGLLQYHSLTGLITNSRFPKEEVWNIVTGPDFVFFQSFSTAFLYQHNRIREIRLPGNVLFLYAVHNRYYLQAIGKGLYELINGQFVALPGTEALAPTAVHTILPSGNGLLIGTRDHGLFTYQAGKLTQLQHAASRFLQRHQCNKGLALPNGRYAFGTILNGMVVTDTTGAILYSLTQREGLQNNTVLALTTDRQGNVWTGLDDGIDAIAFTYPLKYFSDPSGQLGTPYDAAFYNGRLYLGTNHGVYWCDFPAKTSPPVYHLVEGSQGQVWDLAVLDGQLLCGHNAGTYRITPAGDWQPVSNQSGGWHLSPLASRPGFAIQGLYTGLGVYRRDATGQWHFSHQITGFSEPIRAVWEDANGEVWIRHAHNGFGKIRLSSDLRRITQLTWVSSDPNEEALKRSFRVSGPIRRVFSGWQDEHLFLRQDGNLLITNPQGLKAELAISNFAWMDDYENIVPLDSAFYLLCFEKGYALLPRSELAMLSNQQLVSKPLIRQLVIGTTGNSRSFTFRKAAGLTSFVPVFGAKENHLTFQFSLPESLQESSFSYRLLGLDEPWSDFSRTTEKEYTSLLPGTYTFQVRATSDGPITSLSFEILPPWYQSNWAYWGYFLLACALVGVSGFVHRRQVQAQQLKVRQQMEEKLAREQERHRQQLVQLQKEKLEQDIIGKSEELANTTMNLIHKNDLLLKLKGEVEKLKDEVRQRQTVDQATGHINQLVKLIDANISSQHDWKVFEKNFNKVHEQFFKRLLSQYQGLTPDDLRLAAYLRMNLSSKEVAKLLNITVRGVELKRYRLRKRLNLDPETNLNEFMMAF
ncbi:triple tyrosine motif-containing protein [Larkinella sp. VNQ87]|uniref:helix-turn-helix and ligand-binding sensor domain-containing protein n=1 Tax=Larkinella sp. VNQ87 TaxID=3400921 RepID=UPI003C011615